MPFPIKVRCRPLYTLSSPLDAIRFFTPNWFAVTMGTGVLALGLGQVASPNSGLYAFAQLLWILNIGLFSLFTLLYLARWTFFPREAVQILTHSQMSLFLGTIPMGLATIINGLPSFGTDLWGYRSLIIAYHLWQMDVVLAMGCGIVIPLMMFTRQTHSLESMTGLWLLPLVAAEVSAVSGWLLTPYIHDSVLQQQMIIFNMLLWAFSVPIACAVLVILLLRLILHKLPPIAMAASSWLALGPIATGCLGMLLLSQISHQLLVHGPLSHYRDILSGFAWAVGILLWGFGAWWLLIASGITLYYSKQRIPFNLGWWGYTFPLGVFTLATFQLAKVSLLATVFQLASLLLLILAVVWLVVMYKTLQKAWSGQLFSSPCMQLNTHLHSQRE